jgi:undecaprenol kinase
MSKNQAFLNRIRFALNGIRFSVCTERSMRVHVLALVLVLIALIVFAPPPEWWALIGLACGAVVTTELLNTAIEHLLDRLHPEQHPSIGVVKDCAAAAVLVSSMAAIVVAVAFAIHLWHAPAPPPSP